jgi:hypothetical protein
MLERKKFLRLAGSSLSLVLALSVCGFGAPVDSSVGAAESKNLKEASGGEAVIVLNEQLFNKLLDAIFAELRPPTFSLSQLTRENQDPFAFASYREVTTSECGNSIQLEREIGGTKTAVRFRDGRITAQLAFSGTYNVALAGCVKFHGWADTNLNLYFDTARQSLSARFNVEDLHLLGVPSMAGGALVPLVQSALDQRINPLQILQTSQLSARLPVAGSGGSLQMRAADVRPEVIKDELRLHITYEFRKE